MNFTCLVLSIYDLSNSSQFKRKIQSSQIMIIDTSAEAEADATTIAVDVAEEATTFAAGVAEEATTLAAEAEATTIGALPKEADNEVASEFKISDETLEAAKYVEYIPLDRLN